MLPVLTCLAYWILGAGWMCQKEFLGRHFYLLYKNLTPKNNLEDNMAKFFDTVSVIALISPQLRPSPRISIHAS